MLVNTQTHKESEDAEVNTDMNVTEVMSWMLPACRIYQYFNLTIETSDFLTDLWFRQLVS